MSAKSHIEYVNRKTGRRYRIVTRRGTVVYLREFQTDAKRSVDEANLGKSYRKVTVPSEPPEVTFEVKPSEDEPAADMRRLEDNMRHYMSRPVPPFERSQYSDTTNTSVSWSALHAPKPAGWIDPNTSGGASPAHSSRTDSQDGSHTTVPPSEEDPFWTWPYILAVLFVLLGFPLLWWWAS